MFINEKSPMLIRDLDLLREIKKNSHVNVGWSIVTTKDDEVKQAFEPKAPPVSARFEAMRQLAREEIMNSTVFMPIMPFVYDDEKNIEVVVRKTGDCGGQYVLDGGLTLWGYCKTHISIEPFKNTIRS